MSICSAVDSKYVSLIPIRVILASDCSNEFLKKQMFPCRNGNNYEVSLALVLVFRGQRHDMAVTPYLNIAVNQK